LLLSLLQGQLLSNEEKLATLLIYQEVLHVNLSDSSLFDVVLQKVTPEFIVRLIHSKSDIDGYSLSEIGLATLQSIRLYPAALIQFASHVSLLFHLAQVISHRDS
jgi:hypothetical protein